MKKENVDYSIYVVTDPLLSRNRPLDTLIAEAITGGTTVVQYRDKRGLSFRSMIEESRRILACTSKAGIPLIINDRVDLALAVKADGVHLGQEDMPLPIARKYLRKTKIIGITVGSESEARQAIDDGADYLAISPVFPTSTKLDAGIPVGVDLVKKICQFSPIPVIGIGGIQTGNAATVISAGAHGVAVVSAVMSARDPAAAVRSLRISIQKARAR